MRPQKLQLLLLEKEFSKQAFSKLSHFPGNEAEWEEAGMRISTSKSEAMVLSWKWVESAHVVRDELLPRVENFKYLEDLFMSDGGPERETDRHFSALLVKCGEES